MADYKPDILLLPGLMCDDSLWDFMLHDLSQIGNLYFGSLTVGQTITEIASHILKCAPKKFFLISFSLGGYVAREIMMLEPSRVSYLALLNTSARGTEREENERNQINIGIIKRFKYRGLSLSSVKRALHPKNQNDKKITQHIQNMAMRLGQEVFLRQISLTRKDGLNQLKNIGCPTLVVTSDKDNLRSKVESKELAQGIPDADMVSIKNCGHMTPLEQPKELARELKEWFCTVKG